VEAQGFSRNPQKASPSDPAQYWHAGTIKFAGSPILAFKHRRYGHANATTPATAPGCESCYIEIERWNAGPYPRLLPLPRAAFEPGVERVISKSAMEAPAATAAAIHAGICPRPAHV
jgi:hypothetical protein